MESLQVNSVEKNLTQFMFSNAIFLCERLLVDFPTEIPGVAAGHCLLGLIYRYSGRKNSSVEQFRIVLSCDPLCWEAYAQLCSLGVAEETSTVFGNVAAQYLQKTHVSQRINFSEGETKDQLIDSDKASKDTSVWQIEHVSGENQQD